MLLRGLDHADVGRFVEMATGISPPAGLVDAVHTQTEGNPLFVTEVVRLLVQEGELGSDGAAERDSWEVRIPEGVREVIGRRLDRLLARCNEVLTVASVVGREFELRHVDKLVEDLTEDMLLDVLEEGLGARVIEELPSAVGRYQFTHALIQETLTSELSLTRRVRLHARIAATLEDVYGANAAHHAAELAHHFAQAEAMPGPEKMIEYAILAGERALATHAYEQALAHFERALAAKEEGPMDGGTQPTFSLVWASPKRLPLRGARPKRRGTSLSEPSTTTWRWGTRSGLWRWRSSRWGSRLGSREGPRSCPAPWSW